MKILVDQEKFLGAVKNVVSGAQKSKLRPILGYLHLAAKDKTLAVTGCDETLRITTTVAADVKEAGTTCLPADLLHKTLAGLPEEELSLDVGATHRAVLAAEKQKSKLEGMNPADYPRVVPFGKTSQVVAPAAEVLKVLSPVLHAVCTNEVRPNLLGVFLETGARPGDKGEPVPFLAASAFDGARAALTLGLYDFAGLALSQGAILPLRAAKEMVRLLGEATEEVTLTCGWRDEVGGTLMELGLTVGSVDEVKLTSRLVEGQYPDVRSTMPARWKHNVELQKRALSEALKRLSIIAKKGENEVELTFSADGLHLFATAESVGEAEEDIDVAYKGKTSSLLLDVTFLQEALDSCATETVVMGFDELYGPVGIRPVGIPEQRAIVQQRKRAS